MDKQRETDERIIKAYLRALANSYDKMAVEMETDFWGVPDKPCNLFVAEDMARVSPYVTYEDVADEPVVVEK